MAKEDYAPALNYGRTLTQRMGEFGQSWLALAQAQQALQPVRRGVEELRGGAGEAERQPRGAQGAIECYYALNRPSEARNKIRDARRAMPSQPVLPGTGDQPRVDLRQPRIGRRPARGAGQAHSGPPAGDHGAGQAYLATARSYVSKPDKQAARRRDVRQGA
jgi:hypothetical protein